METNNSENVNANGGSRSLHAVVRPQTTTRTTFVVQYKSIYAPREWIDHHSQETYFRQVDAENWAAGVRLVNPNVRVIKRTVTEDEVA